MTTLLSRSFLIWRIEKTYKIIQNCKWSTSEKDFKQSSSHWAVQLLNQDLTSKKNNLCYPSGIPMLPFWHSYATLLVFLCYPSGIPMLPFWYSGSVHFTVFDLKIKLEQTTSWSSRLYPISREHSCMEAESTVLMLEIAATVSLWSCRWVLGSRYGFLHHEFRWKSVDYHWICYHIQRLPDWSLKCRASSNES